MCEIANNVIQIATAGRSPARSRRSIWCVVSCVDSQQADRLEAVAAVCRKRESAQRFTVICVAEGAKPRGGAPTLRSPIPGAAGVLRLGGIAEVLAAQLQPLLRSEVRATVLGHVQRGGAPTAADRVLATLYGAAAADLVAEGAWGRMVSFEQGRIGSVALGEVAGATRRVPPDHPLVRCARRIGVSFGNA